MPGYLIGTKGAFSEIRNAASFSHLEPGRRDHLEWSACFLALGYCQFVITRNRLPTGMRLCRNSPDAMVLERETACAAFAASPPAYTDMLTVAAVRLSSRFAPLEMQQKRIPFGLD